MFCEKCGYDIRIGDFPFCKGSPTDHGNSRFGIIGDDIPGGLDVKHGVCWPDGTPRRFYSKSEIRKAAYVAGLTMADETPKPNQQIVEQRERDRERKR